MIDLSYLTEAEQETILGVLHRDAQLKKAEERRVKSLRRSVKDRGLLKYLSGEWFYETKSLRHRDRIHGCDIVRASMRPKHRPLTLLELSQMLPEKPSFVASGNREVYVPPALCGLIQEDPKDRRNDNWSSSEWSQETPKSKISSPTKQRINPFNSEALAPGQPPQTAHATASETKERPATEPVVVTHARHQEPLSPAALSQSHATNPNPGPLEPIPEEAPNTSSAPFPVYTRTPLFHSSQDCASQAHYQPPRGILKVAPDQGPADSLACPSAVPPSPPDRGSVAEDAAPADGDALGKQVRFGPVPAHGLPWAAGGREPGEPGEPGDRGARSPPAESQDRPLIGRVAAGGSEGRWELKPDVVGAHQVPGELSEHYHDRFPQVSVLLSTEQESGKAYHLDEGTEEDAHSPAQTSEWFKTSPGRTVMSQPAFEAAADIVPTTHDSSWRPLHTASPKHMSRLHERFSKVEAKENTTEGEDYHEEEMADIPIEPWFFHTAAVCEPLDHQINPPSVNEELKFPVPKEVRPLQFENAGFKDGVGSSLDAGPAPQQEDMESKEDVAQKLSNLKAFWERENSGPKVIFAREQATNDNPKMTMAENVTLDNTGSVVETSSPQTKLTQHYGMARSEDETFCQETESSNPFLDLPKLDGTYRAHTILINEETDDSLAGSVKDFQENSPCGPEMCSPLPPEDRSSPHGDKPAVITDLKCFWEKEHSGPKIVVAGVKEASSGADRSSPDKSQDLNSAAYPSQPELSEELENVNILSHTKAMIGKGFVSKGLGKSQLNKLSHESEFSLSHERPLSPIMSQSSRSRDSSDDELRRSPSKTCHPKVLVMARESSLPIGSVVEGSPLKTFPIDIALEAKDHKEEGERPSPVPRQRTPSSQEAKATESPSTPSREVKEEVLSRSLLLPPEDSRTLAASTPLVRSYIPVDYQHYLGSPEKAYLPPFEEEESIDDSAINRPVSLGDAKSKPRRPLRRQGATYGKAMIEGNHSRIRSWIAQNAGSSSSEDKTTSARSDSRASSGSYDDDESSPVSLASKQRPMPMSQSMENLGGRTGEDIISQGQLNVSLDDVGAVPSSASFVPDPMQARRMSKSVPALQPDEMDSDDPFGTKPRRRTASVVSNQSLSSGLASMSSFSGSVTSINHVDFGDIEVQGTAQFAVNYVQQLGELQIFVVQCRDLAVAEPKKSRSDPYVKCYLVPDKTKLGKRKTSVKKRTLNPSYNEILRFKILMEVLKMQKLNISVWHNDTFGRNSFLGEVTLDLSEWDFGNTQINEHTLTPRALTQFPSPPTVRSKPSKKKGQMRVALRYLPQPSHSKKASKMETGEVQIWVKDCKDLPPARGVIIDPFVKCTVLPDTSKKSRQKTRVVKRTANPMFNHTMVYDGFRPEDLREACAEITVWDHDRLNNHYIGGLRLGLGTGKSYGAEVNWMDSTETETSLWEKMMASNGEWVEDILPLRTFVVAKSMTK